MILSVVLLSEPYLAIKVDGRAERGYLFTLNRVLDTSHHYGKQFP